MRKNRIGDGNPNLSDGNTITRLRHDGVAVHLPPPSPGILSNGEIVVWIPPDRPDDRRRYVMALEGQMKVKSRQALEALAEEWAAGEREEIRSPINDLIIVKDPTTHAFYIPPRTMVPGSPMKEAFKAQDINAICAWLDIVVPPSDKISPPIWAGSEAALEAAVAIAEHDELIRRLSYMMKRQDQILQELTDLRLLLQGAGGLGPIRRKLPKKGEDPGG